MLSAGERYRAALERVLLRALRAVEAGRQSPRSDTLTAIERQLGTVEAVLADSDADSRDQRLAHRLELGELERDFLWTAVAATCDPRLAPHAQVMFGGEARRGASVALHALIARLGAEASTELGRLIGPSSPLVRHRLLLAADDLSSTARTWVVAPRLAGYLAGDDTPDSELTGIGGQVVVPDDPIVDDETLASRELARTALANDRAVLLVVDGPFAAGRRTLVASAAAEVGRSVIAVDLARLRPGPEQLDRALAALVREAFLRGAVPLVAGIDELLGPEGERGAELRHVVTALDAVGGACAVTASSYGLELGSAKPQLRISLPAPDTAARRTLWTRALRDCDLTGPELDSLALRYRLGPGAIERATGTARILAEGRGHDLGLRDLIDGVRNGIAERLGGLAFRVNVRQRWDELVLGDDGMDQVKALIARVRHGHTVLESWGMKQKLARGVGVAALFSGPPGTGKTMVAGLIAAELDLELYQVDLSKVVSKWVGETERQLGKIFEAADAGHALLLFDEADALFAKRTEVKAAVDRYANLEVNYLLQRIESFGGVTILTTNMDTSIDPALARRLAAHIKFWPPEHDERVLLWQKMFGPDVPVAGDLDFDALAGRFSAMTGANIRNAAIAGAFLAADEGVPVSQAHLERAARGEYISMGHTLSAHSQ